MKTQKMMFKKRSVNRLAYRESNVYQPKVVVLQMTFSKDGADNSVIDIEYDDSLDEAEALDAALHAAVELGGTPEDFVRVLELSDNAG